MATLRANIFFIVRSLPVSLRFFVALWLSLWAVWQWQVHAPGILGDMWDMLPGYQRLVADFSVATLWQELTRQFAGVHVLAVPKLFYWLNFAFFGGSGALLKALSFLFCFLNMLLLLALLCRDLSQQEVAAAVVLALPVFFNGSQLLVIDWDFLLQHYLAVFFSLLAFWRYEHARALGGSTALAVLAVLCCGSGWVTLGTLPLLWWLRGERRQILCAYGVLALLLVWLLLPETFRAQSDAVSVGKAFLWSAPQLLLAYLGYPFSEWGVGHWAGVLPLCLLLPAAMRLLWQRKFVMADFLGLFFLLIACSVVLGRYRILSSDADLSRYYVYIAPLWFLLIWQCWQRFSQWARVLPLLLCAALLCVGIAAVAAAADHAVRMRMAAVVALNGNFAHLAGLRLNAVAGRENSLQQQSAYLRERGMDIYRDAQQSLQGLPVAAQSCELHLQHSAVVSKGQFVDYFFAAPVLSHDRPLAWYATDEQLRVLVHGVAVPAASRMRGWQLPLHEVRFSDWPLLLPAAWLPREQWLLYTHLPRDTALSSLQWWLVTARGERCAVSLAGDGFGAVRVSAAQE